jgi:8-amino-7-oxononanoate synthase
MLADFTGRPRALLFSTGYMANLGTLGALLSRHDHAVADRLNHASLLDGVRLSGCRSLRYQHADAGDAERKLAAASREHLRLIVTDGVFSMDGDLAPLPELAALAHRQNAVLMVDDAHGFGVLGHQGGGCCEHFQLSAQEVPILVGTLGKAMGTGGAFVAGSEALIDALIQFARPYVYTTAMPPAIAAATRVALQIAREETWRRERLLSLITRLRAGLTQLGLPLPPGTTPIQPIILGSTARATRASAALLERGFLVPAIRPPTVPEGSGRLRITLSAAHTEQQIEDLIDALAIILSGSGNANEGTV